MDKYDIFIQAGQSNADGSGIGPVTEEYIPDERICYLEAPKTVIITDIGLDIQFHNVPFQLKIGEEHGTAEKPIGDFSLTFSKAYIDAGLLAPNRKILIIRAAVGGTGFQKKHWGIGDILYLKMLEMTDYALPEEDFYRYVPRTMTHAVAMDYAAHGGELLQIVGTVVSLTKTADGGGISRLTLKDIQGDLATVVIEDYIGSGAYGTNDLASQIRKGRTVRAMGLLHVDEYGTTVLRVRNCEEVVYVPPVADYSNPKTGDMWRFWK